MKVYTVVKVDLTEPRSKFLLVFESESEEYKTLIFTRVDDDALVKLNDDMYPEFKPFQNLKIEMPIKRIFVSNDQSSVTGATLEMILIK